MTLVVDLPPDFHIEFAILNMHVWLICRRLKQLPGKQADLMHKCLVHQFELFVGREVTQIHLKKKNDFIANLNYFKNLNQNLYERHFFSNPKTSQNPYYKIDALVWSALFFEKVERYSDQVYTVGEYMVQHFRYLNTLSLDDFMTGQIDFDIYRNTLDYKEKIQAINRPLTEEEFEAELESPNPVKKFYYNYDDPEIAMPIDEERTKLVDHRFDKVMGTLVYNIRKFGSLDSYDFYCDREEREKEETSRETKYAWKMKKDAKKLDL